MRVVEGSIPSIPRVFCCFHFFLSHLDISLHVYVDLYTASSFLLCWKPYIVVRIFAEYLFT
jgi:hypothetical protein